MLFVGVFFATNATEMIVKKSGKEFFIASRIDEEHVIVYNFRNCMFNDLFTFYKVSLLKDSGGIIPSNFEKLPAIILNESTSDNIGPFAVKLGGWCGGNHAYKDEKTRTARTIWTRVLVDGKVVLKDTTFVAHDINIEVKNDIYSPISTRKVNQTIEFIDTLCLERVRYRVNGGSIEVMVEHYYKNKLPVIIERYYGMQSMFREEKWMLTPNGQYDDWTPIEKVDRFIKKDYPYFNRFVEKNGNSYQATYISLKGLGERKEVKPDDVVFIGNSWTKSYHKTIGGASRERGDKDSWIGTYTWFAEPIIDANGVFAYEGVINGKQALFVNWVGEKKEIEIPLKDAGVFKHIIENPSHAKIRKTTESLYIKGDKTGSIILSR